MRLPRHPPFRPGRNRRRPLKTTPPARRLRLGRILLQHLHRHPIAQRAFVRRVQEDFGHDRIMLSWGGGGRGRGRDSFLPARGTKTPFAPFLETGDLAEVVAAGGGEVEEFFCEEGGDGVVLSYGVCLVAAGGKGRFLGFWVFG